MRCAKRNNESRDFEPLVAAIFCRESQGTALSKKQLKEFADKLKPVFPRYKIVSGQDRPTLFLYLNEKAEDSPTKPAPVLFVARAVICKELGIKE